MIESSKDILFIVLAFCAVWLAFFIGWLLFCVITILRDAKSLVRQVKNAVEKIEGVVHSAHEKMERSAASFTLVAQAVKEVIAWGIQERAKKTMKARAKKK